MEMNTTTLSIYDRIVALLDGVDAPYDIIDHPPEGRTDAASVLRGHPLQAAAKAMVLKVKRQAGPLYVLAVVPGDRRVDMDQVGRLMGGRSASFCKPEIAADLTRCEMGSVPPFVFDERLQLIVDNALAAEERIYFNAGRLDRSLAITRDAYMLAAQPQLARIAT